MKLDSDMAIVTDEPWPGNGGDSCANTARHAIATAVLGAVLRVNLVQFRTDNGYVRHPKSPTCAPVTCEDWTKTFTSDQAIPLLMAYEVTGNSWLAREMRWRVMWYTAPGKRSHLVLTFLARQELWLVVLAQLVQVLLFIIPIRWSDDNRLDGKFLKFVWSRGSTSDYLNFAAIAEYLWLSGFTFSGKVLLMLGHLLKIEKKIEEHHKLKASENFFVATQIAAIERILWR